MGLWPGRLHADYEQKYIEECKLVGSVEAHDFGMRGPGEVNVPLIG
jgi:hypothetical protein